MCGGGGNDITDMNLTSIQGRDPATERRQIDFWNQAQQYASTSPFQAQYGGPSAMPGLGAMSQRGQQYLTNQILGPGQYSAQNLGFTDYTAPEEGTGYGQRWPSPDWGYEVNEEPITGRTAVRRPRTPGGPPDPPDPSSPFPDPSRSAYNLYGGSPANILGAAPGGRNIIGAQFGMGAPASAQAQGQSGPSAYAGYIAPGQGGLLGSRAEEGARRAAQPAGPTMIGASDPGWEAFLATKDPATQASLRAQVAQYPNMAVALSPEQQRPAQAARPYSPTVGVRGIEEAGDVTRRMLREPGRIGDPAYDQFLPGTGGDPEAEGYVAPGWHGIAGAAGTGAFLPAHTDAEGNTYAAGWHGLGEAGTGTAPTAAQTAIDALTPWERRDPETGVVTDIGYQPGFDEVGAGDVTGAATDPRYSDPTTDPLYKDWTKEQLGLREADEVTDILGAQATGKAFREGWGITDPTISGTDWTGATPWDDKVTATDVDVSQITQPTLTDVEVIGATEVGTADTAGFAVTPAAVAGLDKISAPTDVTVDPSYLQIAGETTTDVADVTPDTIAGPSSVTVDPVTGQITEAVGAVAPGTIAVPQSVTVDPVTGQVSEGIGGAVDPSAFGGASFLTGDLSQYMNQLGVESQIEAAELDYARAQNEEQARRAGSHAWGTRGDIPRAEQESAMLARIADIRRQGFNDAADRLEFDLQRQQAAGMQYQQLQMQGQLAGREEESRRREANAARAQQAALTGQQLGTQAALQTQQLRQAGDIRSAELGLQAGLQGQQLEAQRRSEDAARAQQAALAGQQLGTQAAMQTQQLGQAGGIRGAELGLQAQLQGQQLKAQRREADAARAQQAAMQGLQLGTQAGMQTQQLKQQGGIRGAELGMQAGLQAQQLEAQRLEANAARAQQAALAGQELGGRYGLQTQALGQQAAIRNAEMDMQAALANQQAALQTGTQSQQLEAQRQIEQARLKLAGQQQTQQLGVQTGLAAQSLEAQRAEAQAARAQQAALAQYQAGVEGGMQTQRLGVGADQRQAELDMQAALANQQAALQTGTQAAQLEAGRRGQQAQLDLQRLQQTQQLGASSAEQQTQNEFLRRQALAGMGQDAAQQQVQNEFARRQELARMGLQSQGMGMDDQARFRQQQMQAAQQLASIGGMEQGAAFGAAGQLGQMGAAQDAARRAQQAYAYEQWLRGVEGGSEGMSFLQAMQPGGQQWGYQRKPSVTGQIIGGLAQLGGTAAAMGSAGLISDVRLKENIELVGSDNGFNLYEFNYRNQDARWRGVMAHEVMATRPDAVGMREGVLVVDYDALGMRMEAV